MRKLARDFRLQMVLTLARVFGVPVQVHHRYFGMEQPLK